MLPEEVEARFRKIEDNLVVITELHRRGEARAREDIERLAAIQNGMARWMERMAERQDEYEVKRNALIDAQIQGEAETRQLKAVVEELSRTVDRFLKARTNGGA